MMKKTFLSILIVAITVVSITFTSGQKVRAEERITEYCSETRDYITTEKKTYENSFWSQNKRYYNLLKEIDGLIDHLEAYVLMAENEGYEKKDNTNIKTIADAYSECKQTAINLLKNYIKSNSLLFPASRKSAKNLLNLIQDSVPDGEICYEKYQEGKNRWNGSIAAAFAEKHYDDGKGKCSEFVARCLGAGGFSQFAVVDNKYGYVIPEGSGLASCGTLRTKLAEVSNEYVPQGERVNKYQHMVDIGDVVIWRSIDGPDSWVHAAIITNFDDEGNALYTMHNNKHLNMNFKITSYWGQYYSKQGGVTYDQGHIDDDGNIYYSRLCQLYLYHFK